jgi:hypothetical protein
MVLVVLSACGGGGKPPPSGQVCDGTQTDTQSDLKNCGVCGNVCPQSAHASASCTRGVCGQGACDAGWRDTDPNVPGCETPESLPNTGIVFDTFASASSFGDRVQSSEAHINIAVLGEPTPPPGNGAVTTSNSTHENIGGFNAIQH